MLLSKKQEKILDTARKTYGTRNQLAVAAEECNELAIAVLKFMRYNNEEVGISKTREKVLEERADVEIVLNHIDNIYSFSESELKQAMEGKINRLAKWLKETPDIEYTTVYRTVESKTKCENCFWYEHPEESFEIGACINCSKE